MVLRLVGSMAKRRKARTSDENIKLAIRRAFLYSKLRRDALKLSRTGVDQHQCMSCSTFLRESQCKVDHHVPVVDPRTGFIDWNAYVARMFCDVTNLRTLCDECHKIKTKAEDEVRKEFKTGRYSDISRAKARASSIGVSRGKGRRFSLEHRSAMSKERKGKPQTARRSAVLNKTHERIQKPLEGRKLGTSIWVSYASATEASKVLGIQAPNISRVCNGKQGRKQVSGYEFQWRKK